MHWIQGLEQQCNSTLGAVCHNIITLNATKLLDANLLGCIPLMEIIIQITEHMEPLQPHCVPSNSLVPLRHPGLTQPATSLELSSRHPASGRRGTPHKMVSLAPKLDSSH